MPKLIFPNTNYIFNNYCYYKMKFNIDIFDYFQFDIYENSKSNIDIISEVFTLLVVFYGYDHLVDYYKKHIKSHILDRILYSFIVNYLLYNRKIANFKQLIYIINDNKSLTIDEIKAIIILL